MAYRNVGMLCSHETKRNFLPAKTTVSRVERIFYPTKLTRYTVQVLVTYFVREVEWNINVCAWELDTPLYEFLIVDRIIIANISRFSAAKNKTGMNSNASVFHMQISWWVWFPDIQT